jgi:hypothetical protein
VDGRRYFSLEEDAQLRTEVDRQRNQLIQAVLAASAQGNNPSGPARGAGQERK